MAGNHEGLIQQIVEGIAEAESVDPLELPPLGETIDTDALQTVVDSTETVRVEFEYAGYDIRVTDGTVSFEKE